MYDLSIALDNHGQHGLLSFFSSLPISVLRILELEANKFYDRADFIDVFYTKLSKF